MSLSIYSKLSNFRDKYPEDTKLIEQLALVAFRNNGKIPKEDFTLPNWGYDRERLNEILKEFGISPDDFQMQHIASNVYSRDLKTNIVFFNKN